MTCSTASRGRATAAHGNCNAVESPEDWRAVPAGLCSHSTSLLGRGPQLACGPRCWQRTRLCEPWCQAAWALSGRSSRCGCRTQRHCVAGKFSIASAAHCLQLCILQLTLFALGGGLASCQCSGRIESTAGRLPGLHLLLQFTLEALAMCELSADWRQQLSFRPVLLV